ncbi:LPXTG cell wall anchor domain-containing protein [Euzebya rosea]|uniref:LPXTG cell wall anchor domain-containing protein n=1 Tax=Euzebya rosea TaxID=2052804 RepID=UPI000D3E1E62|nr:LPXTG cell wall anchor domain-containing protein [Euzebya rosea]
MKKFLFTALAVALLVPAVPGGAQLPVGSTPTPTPTPTPTATTAATTSTTPQQIYAGRTSTRGLAVTIAGQGLRAGVTTTNVASDTTDTCTGLACATAAGAAEPFGETATSTTPGGEPTASVEIANLDAFAGALDGVIGAATATTTSGPTADGTANGLTVDVTLTQSVVSQLPAELTGGLNDGLGQIADALQPLADGDPTGIIGGVTDQLTTLLDDLAAGPLLRIQGGQSTSNSTFDDGTVSSTAATEGAIIVLLPTPESTPLLPEGLAVIEVGRSTATASADGTNPATADASASIAKITLLPGILDALPDIDPGEAEGLPLEDLLDLLPEEITDLLPEPITGLLGGGGSEEPTATPTATTSEEGGPTGTPIDDILPRSMYMQADEDSGGFVINLETGTETTCILEDTPLETCITLGGTSQTFSEDNLGVGVLAAGADISLLRADGQGQVEVSLARSEAGAAAGFTQVTPPTPTPTPTPQTGLPSTGGGTSFLVPALMLMGIGGTALFGLRRRRG